MPRKKSGSAKSVGTVTSGHGQMPRKKSESAKSGGATNGHKGVAEKARNLQRHDKLMGKLRRLHDTHAECESLGQRIEGAVAGASRGERRRAWDALQKMQLAPRFRGVARARLGVYLLRIGENQTAFEIMERVFFQITNKFEYGRNLFTQLYYDFKRLGTVAMVTKYKEEDFGDGDEYFLKKCCYLRVFCFIYKCYNDRGTFLSILEAEIPKHSVWYSTNELFPFRNYLNLNPMVYTFNEEELSEIKELLNNDEELIRKAIELFLCLNALFSMMCYHYIKLRIYYIEKFVESESSEKTLFVLNERISNEAVRYMKEIKEESGLLDSEEEDGIGEGGGQPMDKTQDQDESGEEAQKVVDNSEPVEQGGEEEVTSVVDKHNPSRGIVFRHQDGFVLDVDEANRFLKCLHGTFDVLRENVGREKRVAVDRLFELRNLSYCIDLFIPKGQMYTDEIFENDVLYVSNFLAIIARNLSHWGICRNFESVLHINEISLHRQEIELLLQESRDQHWPSYENPVLVFLTESERQYLGIFIEKSEGRLKQAAELYRSLNLLIPLLCITYRNMEQFFQSSDYKSRKRIEGTNLFGKCTEMEKVEQKMKEYDRKYVPDGDGTNYGERDPDEVFGGRGVPYDSEPGQDESESTPQGFEWQQSSNVFRSHHQEGEKEKTRGPDKKGEPDEKIYIRVRDKTGEVEDEEYVSLVEIIQRYHERMMTRGKKEATERGENEGKIPETPVDTSDKTKPPRFIPREKWREERQELDERRKREKKVRDREREQRVIDGARKKSPQYGSGEKEDKKQEGTTPFDEDYEEVRTIEV